MCATMCRVYVWVGRKRNAPELVEEVDRGRSCRVGEEAVVT